MEKTSKSLRTSLSHRSARPGNVLAGLLKRILPDARAVSLGTADDVSKFLEAA